MAQASFYLLGSPRIELDGTRIDVDTRKAVALLAYLAVTGDSHRRDALAALLWPEHDQSHALGALRRTLSALKKSLSAKCLVITREALGTQEDCLWFDVAEFQNLLEETNAHNHPPEEICDACIPLLEKAVALYRGDFMAGFSLRDSSRFDDWQFFQTDTLRSQYGGATQKLALAYRTRGEYERAITCARRWLMLDQLREEAHQELMKLYTLSDQRSAALRQYRECVRILDEELSVAPLEQTTDLYQAILENRFPTPQLESEQPKASQAIVISPSIQEDTGESPELPLVGRTWELDILIKTYFDNQNRGQFFVLEGEAGIGKTRMAGEFLQIVQRNGARAVITQCYKGESHLAYGPFIDGMRSCLNPQDSPAFTGTHPEHWMSEAARLIPELRDSYPNLPLVHAPEGPGAQSLFFEGLRQVIQEVCLGGNAGVLLVDDIHWADEATIDLITYLVRRLRGSNIMILVTWRSEEVPPDHRLRVLLSEAERAGDGTVLKLERLKPADLAALVEELSLTVGNLPPGLADRLYEESEGSPFFAVEYLTSQIIDQSERSLEAWFIPHRVRDLLNFRLAAIDETSRQILSTAAAIGRSFDLQILRSASGRSELETISGLETLIEGGIIQERDPGEGVSTITYDFTHDKLREVAYDNVSLARRRLLHKRAADALVRQAGSQPRPRSEAGQIAQHYQIAGQEDEAAFYYKLAGEHDQSLYANAEALVHFQNALALNHPEKSSLHEAIGDLHTLRAEYSVAITSYETAASLSETAQLYRLEYKLGNVYHRMGQWELAVCHFQCAADDLEDVGDPVELARLYADWSRTIQAMQDTKQAAALAQQALRYAQEAGKPRALAQVHNILGIIARSQNDLAVAQSHLEMSLSESQNAADPEAEIAALNNLALVMIDAGERAQAIERIEAALEICRRLGDRHHEAALLNNLADIMYAQGETEEAMKYLKQAVAIFSEVGSKLGSQIGAQSGEQQPEIWKLSTW